jgi:hypothetical protein
MDIDFARKRGPGRPKKTAGARKKTTAKRTYNRAAAHKRYMANRVKLLRKQFQRYHSDAKYREKKRLAARKYALKRKRNGGKPFYRTGRGGAKKPNLIGKRKLKRVHKPNKRAPGAKKPGRKKGSKVAKTGAKKKGPGRPKKTGAKKKGPGRPRKPGRPKNTGAKKTVAKKTVAKKTTKKRGPGRPRKPGRPKKK